MKFIVIFLLNFLFILYHKSKDKSHFLHIVFLFHFFVVNSF